MISSSSPCPLTVRSGLKAAARRRFSATTLSNPSTTTPCSESSLAPTGGVARLSSPSDRLFRTGARAEVSSREGHARRDLSPRVCPDPVETFRCEQNNEAQCIWYYRLAQLIIESVEQASLTGILLRQELESESSEG